MAMQRCGVVCGDVERCGVVCEELWRAMEPCGGSYEEPCRKSCEPCEKPCSHWRSILDKQSDWKAMQSHWIYRNHWKAMEILHEDSSMRIPPFSREWLREKLRVFGNTYHFDIPLSVRLTTFAPFSRAFYLFLSAPHPACPVSFSSFQCVCCDHTESRGDDYFAYFVAFLFARSMDCVDCVDRVDEAELHGPQYADFLNDRSHIRLICIF